VNVPLRYQINGEGSNAIASSIEREIRDGRLTPGVKLPTVRALAKELQRSHGTIAAAYRILQTRGVIVSDGRRGTIVRPAPPVFRSVGKLEVAGDLENLADGNPDPALLPRLTTALRAVPKEPVLYGGPAHDARLMERAARAFKSDNVGYSAIAVLGGALDGIERALAANLRAGDEVAVEDPIYPAHLDLLGALGLTPIPVPLDEHGMLPDRLAAAIRRGARALLISPRAQNPTGAAIDAKRQVDLLATIAQAENLFVIEDDHAWLVAGAPYRSLTPKRERWFVVRSFSKPFGPDLRIAIASGDPATIARIKGTQQLGVGWVSNILQSTALALWGDPAVMRAIDQARASYAARRGMLIAALAQVGIDVSIPSGLNCWIPVADESATLAQLRDAGYACAPGTRFRIETPPAIRATIARLSNRAATGFAAALAQSRHTSSATRST
jgi:DNA-binding transcriptional MocR family regulator